MPVPTLAEAFVLTLQFGHAVNIDGLATGGCRRELSLEGGRAEGPLLCAAILAGHGGHTLLIRKDGGFRLEACYLLSAPGGAVLRLSGHGSGGAERETRMTLQIETSEPGLCAELAHRVYVGCVLPRQPECVQVWEVR